MSVEFNKEYELGKFAYFSNDKINAEEVSREEYISTENMVVDRGGVEKASKLPSVSKFNSFKKTDTLFSNIRTYFRKVWMASFDGGASADVLVFRTKDASVLDPAYLYYLISNKDFADYSVLTAKGVKMPRGDKTALMQYKFLLPDLEKQLQYASALKSIDDKIENNRRMNETLEGMAQAIFKSWFVDFDPVHAKVEALKNGGSEDDARLAAMCAISGKSTGALAQLKSENPDNYAGLAATADAFPSSFNEAELPEEWQMKKLGKIADLKQGKYLSDISDAQSLEYPYPAFGGGNIRGYVKKYDFEYPETLVTCRGSGCGLLQRSYHQSAITNSVIAIKPFKKVATRSYIFYLSSLLDFLSVTTGSAQPQITISNLSTLDLFYPPYKIQKLFSDYVRVLHKKSETLRLENQSLAETRDALLPKLLSGEIDVSAVRIAEDKS